MSLAIHFRQRLSLQMELRYDQADVTRRHLKSRLPWPTELTCVFYHNIVIYDHMVYLFTLIILSSLVPFFVYI